MRGLLSLLSGLVILLGVRAGMPDFTHLGSTCVDGLPVMMGIEVLKVRGLFRYLCMSGVDAAGRDLGYDTVKVDAQGREVWRGTLGGCWGLVFDGGSVWVGETSCDRTTGKWSSRLVRKCNDLPASVSVTPHLVHGRVHALDVAVDALDAPRALYLATGSADVGGETTNGWTRVARVGTVPAGATRVEDLPVAGGDSPLARVFLGPAPEAGSEAYVAGPVAQWDGIDNAGRGRHDATAASPVELVRGLATTATGTVPAAKDHFRLGDGYLTFSALEIVAACNAGAATVEILLAPDGEPVHNGGLLAFGDTSRAFWIYERSFGGQRHLIGDATYHGALAGDFQGLNIPWDGTGTNLCAFVLATGSSSQVRRDGAHVAALNRFKTDCGDAVCRIGSLGGQWAGIRGRAKVFSIRVYNRVLTPAERARNFAVDRMRFLLPADARTVVTVR